MSTSKAQIIALEPGDIRQTTTLRDALEKRGVFGAIFFPPATPEKRCIIRFTVNCGLTRRELDRVLEVCDQVRDEVGMADWRSTKRKPANAANAPAGRVGKRPSILGGGVLGGWLNNRQLNRKAGADVHSRLARDGAAGAFNNHPAE